LKEIDVKAQKGIAWSLWLSLAVTAIAMMAVYTYYGGWLYPKIFTVKHADGTRSEVGFKRTGWSTWEKEGVSRTYYSDGGLQEEMFYHDDAKHGIYRSWYENGAKMQNGVYENGRETGIWTTWNEVGQVIHEQTEGIAQ